MTVFYPAIEIPLLCVGFLLWILCYHLIKKNKETEAWPHQPNSPPSVYVVPIHEEEQQGEGETERNEAHFQPPYREPPMYSARNASPPPPYMLETPSYQDPSYSDPPAYSEQP